MKHQDSSADWLPLLSEPAAVVTAEGEVVRANDAFTQLLGVQLIPGTRLDDFVISDDHTLNKQLRRWAQNKQPVPGAFRLNTTGGDADFVVEAGRLSPAQHHDGPVTILIRCRPKAKAIDRFRVLGEKVDALSEEILARRKAEAEQRAARRRIEEQEERYRTTLASIGDAVLATDTRGRVTFMNPIAERLTGWTMAEALGKDSLTVFNIVNEQSRQRVESPVTHVLREGMIVGLANHTILIARDGREIPIDDSGAPIRSSTGELIGTVLVFRDISERHTADQTRARLAAIVENSEDAVIGKDLNGTITEWNSAASEIFGYTAEEAVGQSIFSILIPDDRQDEEHRMIKAVREGRRISHFETKRLHKDGHLLDVSLSISPIKDTYGRVIGAAKIARDITQQKLAEQRLQESEARFRTMADSAPVLIWVSDTAGKITYFNKQWLDFTGRSHEQEVGDGWLEGVHPADRQRCMDIYRRSLETQDPFRMEYRVRRHDGEYRWIFDQSVARYSPEGLFVGYLGSCIDITEHREAERQLQSLNKELEKRVENRTSQLRELTQQLTRAEQRERRRIAQALHDNLQQMLVAARMRVETLERRTTDPKVLNVTEQVQKLINQSIEASRSLTLELSPPVLYDGGLCAALPWLARHMDEQYELQVTAAVADEAEPHDEDMRVALFFAARELLFNIVKHSQTNQAQMSLSVAEDERVHLTVQDEGVGFDPETVRDTKDDETGFGLFSLRERIEFMGGQMRIDSTPGGGTCIDIAVPQRHSIADAPPSVRAAELRKQAQNKPIQRLDAAIRVLLVDDHQILREGIAGILMECPDVDLVAEAADGQQAVELAAEHRPDVVIMDITMPRLNGIEATRLITEQLPSIQVIGLSMHDSEDMRQAMTAAGAVDLLMKNGPSDELIQAIRNVATR